MAGTELRRAGITCAYTASKLQRWSRSPGLLVLCVSVVVVEVQFMAFMTQQMS